MKRILIAPICLVALALGLVTSLQRTTPVHADEPSPADSAPAIGSDQPADDILVDAPVRGLEDGGIAGGTPNGPDVIVSTVGSTLSEYGVVGGIGGYSMTTVSCNLGEADAIWIDSTNLNDPNRNQHPVIGQNLYRLATVNGATRFEQIGISWLKHGFCAADAPSCGSPYEPNGSCDWLGTHATDTYSASLNGQQSNLGPRSEVNAWTGVFPYPYVLNWNLTGNAIYKRLQVVQTDVQPASNPGALYFAEVQYICTDEQPVNRYNNVSWRRVTVGTQVSGQWDLSITGSTNAQQPAIEAWDDNDPGAALEYLYVPDDGLFVVGNKATNLGGGQYHYEFAVYNMNSHRSAQAFAVSFPDTVTVTNVGFRDVTYHSGEPYSGTDWTATQSPTGLSWATETYAQNANANAIRWGTMYNFRFDSPVPPTSKLGRLSLFRPGAPDSLTMRLSVPRAIGDMNCDGVVDNGDIDAFVLALTDAAAYRLAYPACDINNGDCNLDGVVDNGDIDAFVAFLTR